VSEMFYRLNDEKHGQFVTARIVEERYFPYLPHMSWISIEITDSRKPEHVRTITQFMKPEEFKAAFYVGGFTS
jgi:hypothetical protein